jgi:ABC-type multidrug transport system ATPase subunit
MMRQAPLLDIRDLAKRYGRRVALDGVTFSARPGSIVALLGPNGAGKTTLFKCVLGVTACSGSVEVAGQSVSARGKQVRRRIGYLPQSPAFNDRDTCRQALGFLADLRDAPDGQADSLLKRVGLEGNAEHRVGELSGGMRQRLALAAALLSDPDLLLLDEPTANLDLESRERLETLMLELKSEGKTIIVSTHFVDGIDRIADQILVLNAGRVVLQGATQDLLGHSRDRHFSVYLNGTEPSVLMEALKAAGIGPYRVTPVEHRLAEIVGRAIAAPESTGDSS